LKWQVIQKAIDHKNNNTVPVQSPLPAFKVHTNRSPKKEQEGLGGTSPVPFAVGTPKYAMKRAMDKGIVVDEVSIPRQ
jgi:hypothetical protein